MLKVTHNAGFFSCCTIRLENILSYFNSNKCLPEIVDSSEQFDNYKPEGNNTDITNIFFKTLTQEINYEMDIFTTTGGEEHHISNYKNLSYDKISPFINKYFTLSNIIENKVKYFENKYNLDYNNLCVLFYRGLAKYWETNLAPYQKFIDKAEEIKNNDSGIKFLIQSDESEFFEYAKNSLNNLLIFDEIIHTSKNNADYIPDVEKKLHKNERLNHAINFLAIVKIMSKCKYVITYSGNAGYWICLFRGNANNVYQYLEQKEYIYGVKNLFYNPNKDNYWL